MNIEDLSPREFVPLTEGIFAAPDDVYRAAPEVSQSMLKLLRRSPAHLQASLTEPPKPSTEAQILGNITDYALLEPFKFKDSYHVRPEGMKFTTTEGKAWKAAHSDRPIIYPEDELAIKSMIESVLSHKIAGRIIEQGFSQPAVFCHERITGVLRKGRLDKLLLDTAKRPVIADLKTCENGSPRMFANAVAKFWYHCQGAYYSDILRDLIGESPFFPFISIEKTPPYACTVYQLDSDSMDAGRKQYQADLELFARCRDSGIWPSYSNEIETIRLPKWALDPQSPIIPD
jgi:hypothetical protein